MSNFCFTFLCIWLIGFMLSESLYLAILKPLRPDSMGYCTLLIFLVSIPASLCAAAVVVIVIDRMKPQRRNETTALLAYEPQIYGI